MFSREPHQDKPLSGGSARKVYTVHLASGSQLTVIADTCVPDAAGDHLFYCGGKVCAAVRASAVIAITCI